MACSTVSVQFFKLIWIRQHIFLFTMNMFPNYTYDYVQMLVQMVLLGWLYMADILENPFGFNPEFDINLDEVTNPRLQILETKSRSLS